MAKLAKERLDKLLVARGLCQTRSQAQGMILAGQVLIDQQVADKPGMLYPESVAITLKDRPPYVSRGGLKLEKALADFEINVSGRVCLDVGASTGGFTDCLLQHGAAKVYAVDVGYGQFDWGLRQDPRVVVVEKTHILHLDPAGLTPSPSLAVVDVSFISLKKVLPHTARCLADTDNPGLRHIVALVKPQFEYRDYCPIKGFQGVVTDPEHHQLILSGLAQDVMAALPEWSLVGVTASPLKGPKGNREFFFWLQSSPQPVLVQNITAWVEDVVFKHL